MRTIFLVAFTMLLAFSVAGRIGSVYGAAPSCTTLPPTNVTATSATLRGSVNPNGKLTGAQFFGDIPTFSAGMSPPQNIGSGVVAVPVSYMATGLTPSTSYQYTAGAANSDGSCPPAYVHFTTLPAVASTDWAVGSVGIQPSSPHVGDPVTLQATVIVLSTTGGYPQHLVAQCVLDGNSCGSGTITYPGPTGVPFTVTSGSKWMATVGTHTLSWQVSTANDPNPGNNFGSYTFSIAAPTPFDFDISASPNSLTLQPSQTQSATVAVNLKGGTAQPVSLMVSGQPSGVTASLSPTSGTPTFSSTMTIAVSSTVGSGTYTLTIAASGGGQSHSTSLVLTISQAPDFRIDLNPPSQSAAQGQVASYSISVVGNNGFSSQVSLSVTGLPAGANGVFSTNSGTPTFSSTLTVTLPGATPTGTYTLVIHGTGGGLDRTANAVLSVTTQTESTSQTVTTSTAGAVGLLDVIQQNGLLIIAALVVLAITLAAVAMRRRARPTPLVPRVPSQVYCGKCGTGNPAENEFCSSCGSKLKAS
jgi:hypothetical protein